MSSFLDNIAAALIGGAMAHQLFKGACISATWPPSSPLECRRLRLGGRRHDDDHDVDRRHQPAIVLDAYVVAAVVALVIVATSPPSSSMPTRRSSSMRTNTPGRLGPHLHRRLMLVFAVGTNITVNVKFPSWPSISPSSASPCGWRSSDHTGAPPRLGADAGNHQGLRFPALAGACASMMPVEQLPPASWVSPGAGLHFGRLRQHSAHCAGLRQGGYDWGVLAYTRLRRFDALVRLVGRRCAVEHVPGSQVGGAVGQERLAARCVPA